MRKIEFERKLLSRIEMLPRIEKDKVIDYYNELYYDKLDSGFSEEAIVDSWGDPDDAAIKILSESDKTENTYSDTADETKFKQMFNSAKQKCSRKLKNRTFWIIYFSAFVITFPLTAALFSVVVALLSVALVLLVVALVVPVSLILAGIAGVVFSVYLVVTTGAPGVVQLGAMLGMIAVGIFGLYFTKLLIRAFKTLFRKKEKAHE